jgi:nucleotide-binding universal stress UspA family protein
MAQIRAHTRIVQRGDHVAFTRASGVPMDARLEFGSASQALIEATTDALMLVVGNRGRGGQSGARLGSVSAACVHHACCPVVVITLPDRAHPPQVARDPMTQAS